MLTNFLMDHEVLIILVSTLLFVSLLRIRPDLEDILLGTIAFKRETYPYLGVLFVAGCYEKLSDYVQLVSSYYWPFYLTNVTVGWVDIVAWPLFYAILFFIPLCILVLWNNASPKARDCLIIGLALNFYTIGSGCSLDDHFCLVYLYGIWEHLRHNLPTRFY